MIIAYIIYDTPSLLACSLTSRSWYIAAVPHLHRTLTIRTSKYHYNSNKKIDWPEPLRMAAKFGWLPFFTRLVIFDGSYFDSFSQKYFKDFHHRTQRAFSALTNVRELSIDCLDIPSFIPEIRQYFGQFSPTVRSLTLKRPIGFDRQIVFFIGLFPHLEDLEFERGRSRNGSADDPTLIPSFTPSLRGRLTATGLDGELAKTMIDLFGGVRFRHVTLFSSGGTQRLLYACANTLETLKLDAVDLCGEKNLLRKTRVPVNDFTGSYSHRDLDLSRNMSLRKLEITAKSLIRVLSERAPATIPSSFRAMFSTVKSHAFSDFVVIYGEGDFYNDVYSKDARIDEGTWYHRQFEVFREMRKARDFRLVLQACYVGDESVRELKRAVAAERAKGLPMELSMPYTLA